MHRITPKSLFAVAAAALALAATGAVALTRGATDQGWPFISGGIGQGEIASLDAERSRYSLKVVTAARVTGAFLAEVSVRVKNAEGRAVFERKLDGPVLLIDLPLGRFTVEASFRGEQHEKVTTIHAGDRHEMFFYFDVAADVLPDPKSAPVRK